jgi:type VI secretion system secreted protein Hcp
MAFDAFLKIDGIQGDSADEKHLDWIEVNSFHHGISQPAGGASSAQGVHTGGRADHQEFTITKRLDSASPTLALYCCEGRHIPEITMECCRAMGEKTVFMLYRFKDTIVASVGTHGSAESDDPIPMEEVSFRYGEIHWEYTPTDPTGGGKTKAPKRGGWSVHANKAL